MSRIIKILSIVLIVFALNAQPVKAKQTFWEAQTERNFSIYPNPAINMVNINYEASTNYQIVISNILGTVIYKSPTISQFTRNHVIRLMDLHVQSGIYLIKIYEGTTVRATKKLIVKRA